MRDFKGLYRGCCDRCGKWSDALRTGHDFLSLCSGCHPDGLHRVNSQVWGDWFAYRLERLGELGSVAWRPARCHDCGSHLELLYGVAALGGKSIAYCPGPECGHFLHVGGLVGAHPDRVKRTQ